MTIDFQNNFWGDKQNGFDVLYQNLKCGSAAVKELAEFFRSRSFLEEYNVTFLTKLSKKANSPQLGTFQPMWQILKSSTEKLSSVHMQTLQRLNQLIKEINKYCDDHHKKQKQIKNEEIATIEAINELKETLNALNKAKEFYFAKTLEVEKLRRENASQKDIEKAESRVIKSCAEYKNLIEKYRKAKEDFEKKFSISCQNFQKIEEDHSNQMKNYLSTYSEILESGHVLMGQVYKEFRSSCNDMSTTKLLESFIHSKGTGTNRPAVIQFEEANNTSNSLQQSLSSATSTTLNHSSNFIMNSSSATNSTNNNNCALGGNINTNHNTSGKNPNNSYPSSVLDILNQDSSSITSSNTIFPSNSIKEYDSKVDNINHLMPTNSKIDGFSKKLSNTPEVIDLKCDAKSYTTIETIDNHDDDKIIVNNQKDHHKSFPDIPCNTKTSKWFLRNRKDKMKDKKGKKKDSDEESNSGSISQIFKTEPYQEQKMKDFMVDSEGYSLRPPSIDDKKDNNFYSSSDSDSEEEKEKKIFVKINPLPKVSENQSNVDQLIASATALTLAPTATQSRRSTLSTNPSPIQNDASSVQRPGSTSNSAFHNKTKQENDLFDLFNDQNKIKSTANNHSNVPDNLVLINSLAKNSKSTNEKETNNNETNVVDRYAVFSELSSPSNSTNILPLPPKSSESTTLPPMNLPPPPTSSSSNQSLSKSISSTWLGGGGAGAVAAPSNSFSVYKPSLFKSQTTISSSSNGMMSRADSIISLSSDFRMTPISCSSRDSSPLTISMSDTIPIALAFQESVGCCFKGSDENLSKVNIIGCIKIAFSAGIIQVLTSNPYLPQLMFKLKNANNLDKVIISKELIEQVDTNSDYSTYEMNMNALQSSIKRLHDQSPNARYYNLDIVKYQVTPMHGAKNAPLQLVSYWKCDENTTNLKIDFKYNSSAFVNSLAQPLKNVLFTANIDSNVISMVSQPFGKWDSLTKQATWRYNEITSTTENNGLGSIKAKFDISNGPALPSSVYVQFACQNAILSGLDFELIGTGYRLSLVKRQFCAGRYYCEPRIPKQ